MGYHDLPDAVRSKIRTVELRTLDEVLKIFTEQPWQDDLKRFRSPYFYRGLPNADYTLQTTLFRNCGAKQKALERVILRNFTKYCVDYDPQMTGSIWRQMVIGQHHGLPTRLMDWSYSPLVGLHFAVSEANPGELGSHDCSVWRIDIGDVKACLPDKYSKILDREKGYIFTIDMLSKAAKTLQTYDRDMKAADALVVLEPLSIDQRIVSQYSFFTPIPMHITVMEKFIAARLPNSIRYVIKKDLRWRVRDMLDQMNINERMIYPGVDGIAAWLKRYYFVKP